MGRIWLQASSISLMLILLSGTFILIGIDLGTAVNDGDYNHNIFDGYEGAIGSTTPTGSGAPTVIIDQVVKPGPSSALIATPGNGQAEPSLTPPTDMGRKAIESSGVTAVAGTWAVPSDWAYRVHPDGTVENAMGVKQSTGVTGAAANINWAASRGKTLMAEGTFNITSAMTGVSHSLYGMGEGGSVTGPGSTILRVTSNLLLGTADGYDNGNTASIIRLAASGTSAAPIVIGGFDIDGNMEMFESTYASFGGPLARDHDYITFDHLYVHHMPKSHGIEFINAHHIKVTNCEIGHIGGYRTFTIAAGGTIFARPFGDGVAAGDGGLSGTSMCHDCLVENCWVHDCSMVAVNWEPGYNNIVRDCTLHASGTWWSIAQQKEVQAVAVTAYSMDDFSITTHDNSYIGCDISCPGGLAMRFGLSDNVFGPTDATTIDDCHIHDCANGIHFDGGTSHIISDTDVRTSGGACLTTANTPEMTITNSTCNLGPLVPPGSIIPIRWTWVDCPTEVHVDTDNSYTARLEVWDQTLNAGVGGWRTDHGMSIIYSFISLSGGTDHTVTCTPPTEGTASGECTVTFRPTATGPYAVRADWDHSSTAYSRNSSEIMTISVIDQVIIPIQWTWVHSPPALTVGQTYTYELEILFWDADLNAFRASSNTHVHYHFVSQTPGVPNYTSDCHTPQSPADLTGRCVIEFTPEDEGVWELHAEWDSTGVSGYSTEPSSTVTVTATPNAAQTVPSVPLELQAQATDGRVTLTWSAPTTSGSSAVTGYKIYRGTSSNSLALLATVVDTEYSDGNVVNGQSYHYQVSAVSAAGESERTAEVVTTPSTSGSGLDTTMLLPIASIAGVAVVVLLLFLLLRRRPT